MGGNSSTVSQAPHRGIAEEDPRNRGVIAHFRPPDVTEDYVRARFTRSMRHKTPAQIEALVAKFMADITAKPPRPPPPLSQPLEQVADPLTGLSTHPDIVERLWEMDRALPHSCRWAVWGYPALVHPQTGVIFAIGFGTIGIVARLPPDLRASRPTIRPTNPGQQYDISPAGAEWRFLTHGPEEPYCRAAFDYAASLADG
jgi:hypothetical protein